MGVENTLDLVKERLINQRLMSSLVFGAVIRDIPEVVAVPKDVAQSFDRDGGGWPSGSTRHTEASFSDLGVERGDCFLAGGELNEGHTDVRSTVWVKNHGIDLVAFDHNLLINVPNFGVPDRAPVACLVSHLGL